MDPQVARAHRVEPEFFEFKQRDAILYALGIGARAKEDLRYVYEVDENFSVFPTYIVAPGFAGANVSDWPGIDFDLTRILHGEHYIEIYKPLPAYGTLKKSIFRSHREVVDILDKGSGALILSNITTYDETGDKLAMQQFGTFQVGSGGFGGSRSSPAEFAPAKIPQRKPDAVVEQQTSVDQAALYRQGSGDLNPLHVDPEFAKMSGFKQPILHGLCTLGFSARHVIQQYADNDANKLKAIKVRFSSPVIPGQTLQTEMWMESDRIIFQTKVKETGKVVISNAWVRLEGQNPISPNKSSDKKMADGLKCKALFDQIKAELPNTKDAVKKVNGIVLYEFTQGGKPVAKITLDLKNAGGDVYEGEPKNGAKPNVTMIVDDEDFLKIAEGKLDATKAFMSGKIKAKGNIMMLQKLTGILKGAQKSKL